MAQMVESLRVNARVVQIVRWLMENAERVERPVKGELTFRFGGRCLGVELKEHETVERGEDIRD